MERFYTAWPKLLLKRWKSRNFCENLFFQLQVRYKYSMAQLYLTENYSPDTGVGIFSFQCFS